MLADRCQHECGHDVCVPSQSVVLACDVPPSCVVWAVVASDEEAEPWASRHQVPSLQPGPRSSPWSVPIPAAERLALGDPWVLGTEAPAQRPLATNSGAQSRAGVECRPPCQAWQGT